MTQSLPAKNSDHPVWHPAAPPLKLGPLQITVWHLLTVALFVAAVTARFWMSAQTHSLGEDALITLRYAENIAAGHGWVYNPGERVLGTTTPLLTVLLALATVAHLPAMPTGIALNIFADGVSCVLIARLLASEKIGRPAAGLFAAALYALSSTPINISISGMETGLVTCAGLAMVTAYIEGRPRLLGALGATLFLLRIDGLVLFGLLLAGWVWHRRRFPAASLAMFALLSMPWILFAAWYFGSPVPVSLVAKLTVYTRTAVNPGSGSGTVAFNHEAFRNQFLLGWPQRIVSLLFLFGAGLIVVSVVRSIVRRKPERLWLLAVPALWLILYYGAMLVSHVPAFPWYFLPPWPLFLAVAMLAASALAESAGGAALRRRRIADPLFCVAFALLLIGLRLHLPAIREDIHKMQAREDTLRRPLGYWLRDHMLPTDRVLMEPIGYAGYYSGRRILDMIGLVSPEVLPYYRAPNALSGIVNGLRPEWLCLRRDERDLLHRQDPTLPDSQYDYVQGFPSEADTAFVLYRRRR